MIVDGRSLAAEILATVKAEVSRLSRAPRLTILTGIADVATQTFLKLKGNMAGAAGIDFKIIKLPGGATTEKAVTAIKLAAKETDGIIVHLPLPPELDVDAIRPALPPELDVDAIHYTGGTTNILPPVVGAISEIVRKCNLVLTDKKIVIVGRGSLVGRPAADWLRGQGHLPISLTRETASNQAEIAAADILILGAGVPHLITPAMIKEGVVIFDAGTSEASGELVGDASSACAVKAALFTPVPGGIGPITIALVLRNLIDLVKQNQTKDDRQGNDNGK